MHAIEKLQELTRQCEPCIWYGKIIEYEELPEDEKYRFECYLEKRDFIVFCEKCKLYIWLRGEH